MITAKNREKMLRLCLFRTHRQLLVPSRQKRREGRAFLLRFHWKKCWRNRPRLRWSCRSAFGHQAEFHALSSKVPNRHYQSVLRLGRRELRYTRAEKKREKVEKSFQNCRYTCSSPSETAASAPDKDFSAFHFEKKNHLFRSFWLSGETKTRENRNFFEDLSKI